MEKPDPAALRASQEILAELGPLPGEELAFLASEGTLYFARHCPAPGPEPTSAVVKLIQGIYESEPAMARRIVRSRIYSTARPTEMCLGMVKVAAKRLSAPLDPAPPASLPPGLKRVELLRTGDEGGFSAGAPPHTLWESSVPPRSDADFLRLAGRLAEGIDRTGARHAKDRPVAALLVSEGGEILGWALNTNARNRTLHAEINLIQGFHRHSGVLIPRGARIYTTLKPCKMCAAMIWHCADHRASLRVCYSEFDPGPNARETVLNRGTFERKRASGSAAELELDLEFQVAT